MFIFIGAWVAHTAAVRGDPVARPPSSSTVSSTSIASTIPANERECLLGPGMYAQVFFLLRCTLFVFICFYVLRQTKITISEYFVHILSQLSFIFYSLKAFKTFKM